MTDRVKLKHAIGYKFLLLATTRNWSKMTNRCWRLTIRWRSGRGRGWFPLSKIEHQQTSGEQGDSENEDGKVLTTPRRKDLVRREVRSPFHPFRCRFEAPGNKYDYGEANEQ